MEKKVKIVVAFEVLLLSLFLFLYIFRSFFFSVSSLDFVFEQAKAYTTISEIAKAELQSIMPEKVKNDPIAYTVITYGIDKFVTPQLVERLAEPALKTAVKIAQAPTSIQENDVVLNTTQYKSNLTSNISSYNLPEALKTAATNLVNAVPENLKIVDLSKRPNSIIGQIVKLKEKLHRINDALWIIGIAALALIGLMFYYTQEKLNIFFKALSVSIGISGIVTLLISVLVPLFINYFPLYSQETKIDSLINTMIVNLVDYYMRVSAGWGLTLAILGGVAYIFTVEKVQKSLKETYGRARTKLK